MNQNMKRKNKILCPICGSNTYQNDCGIWCSSDKCNSHIKGPTPANSEMNTLNDLAIKLCRYFDKKYDLKHYGRIVPDANNVLYCSEDAEKVKETFYEMKDGT